MKTVITPVFVNRHGSDIAVVRNLANHQCEGCGMEFLRGTNMARFARYSGGVHPGGPVMGVVHHLDGNAENWRWNNLRYVCTTCDRKLKREREQAKDVVYA